VLLEVIGAPQKPYSEIIMDEDVFEIKGKMYCPATNILCSDGTIEEALQLSSGKESRFWPLECNEAGSSKIIKNWWYLYLNAEEEYKVISSFLDNNNDTVKRVQYCHLLNLRNKPEDIILRQNAVKLISNNQEIYNTLAHIIVNCNLFRLSGYHTHHVRQEAIMTDIKPEHVNGFIEDIKQLEKHDLQDSSLERLCTWARGVRHDTYFKELFIKKRKATDARLFAVFSERYNGAVYGLLKPGLKPEDVFDFLGEDAESYWKKKETKRGKTKRELREVVKYKTHEDEQSINLALGHARQRMDILNELARRMFDIPAFLMYLQLKHLFLGAYMHHKFIENGYPANFPEIVDEPGALEFDEIYPIRMLLDTLSTYGSEPRFRKKHDKMCTNSIAFPQDKDIYLLKGPNYRGKSELFRTVNLFIALANSGYPVPALGARYAPVPGCYFISCKGDAGRGGSELERGIRGVQHELENVQDNSYVILDELGDAANAPTAREFSERILPELIKRGCKVFATTHHDALSSYVDKELNSSSYMPDPAGKGVERFKIIPAAKKIDFKAQEVLDDMGFTARSFRDALPKNKAPYARKMRDPEDDKMEIPF
jgi:hypothetical protein